ncbi:MAG: hypothetical protein RR768_03250 [Clostridium sp.]
MKKMFILILILVIMTTACGNKDKKSVELEKVDGGYLYKKSFGEFIVPENWIESDYSQQEKYVYAKEETDNEEEFNNFVIGYGKNNYSVEEHEQFRQAILQQLSANLNEFDNATLNGEGTYTEQGDVLYIFKITEENGIVTTQYYIIGEKKHCMIQETNYDSSEECDEATKKAVNSFVWAD